MKKIILSVVAAACAASMLCACGKKEEVPVDPYAKLNEMMAADYSKIIITVEEEYAQEGVTLESEYIIKYSASEIDVVYDVERFAPVSVDSSNENFKQNFVGEAKISNGQVSGGEDVGISADTVKRRFDFRSEYFENASITDTTFSADVINISAFTGRTSSYDKMSATSVFSDVFESMLIKFNDGENKVTLTYEFTK